MDFTQPLSNLAEGKAWIEALVAEDLMFHFEDGPEDQIVTATGLPTFTAEEAAAISERLDELYGFDWGTYECPIGYALEVMGNGE